jgi:hypothetical protein
VVVEVELQINQVQVHQEMVEQVVEVQLDLQVHLLLMEEHQVQQILVVEEELVDHQDAFLELIQQDQVDQE